MTVSLATKNVLKRLKNSNFSNVELGAVALWIERECILGKLNTAETKYVKSIIIPTYSSRLKLMVFGKKQHGKDTVCEYFRDHHNVTFASSSYTACNLFIFEQLKQKYGYTTADECFNDRRNHRQLWYELIKDFNLNYGLSALGKIIYRKNSIYCGIRDKEEFYALKSEGCFDLAIWVDASERVPYSKESYMALTKEDADLIITNNGSQASLHEKLDNIYNTIIKP